MILAPKTRKKNKDIKKTKIKTMNIFSIVRMYNEFFEKYDNSIFKRKTFMNNKITISWINLIIWFSSICKKVKKMCIKMTKRVSKKTNSDNKSEINSQFYSVQFSQFSGQFFQSQQFFQLTQSFQSNQFSQSNQSFQFSQINVFQSFSEYIPQPFQQFQLYQ